MRLTAKIIALFLMAASILVAAGGFFSMQREVGLFQEEMARRHAELAQAWAAQIRPTLAITGPDGFQFSAESTGVNEQAVHVRWVYRDAPASSDLRPYASPLDLADMRSGEIRSLPVELGSHTELYCSYFALGYSDADSWLLELSEAFTRRDAYTRGTFLHTIYMLVGLGLLGVLTLSLVGMRLVGRPLDALVAKTKRAADGDLSVPLHIQGHDELSQLAVSLNHMCDSLQASQQKVLEEAQRRSAAEEQLRHADRLKTVGRLGAGIAHELGTPLNVVSGRAALIADGRLNDEDVKRSAETIRAEARRMTTLIEGLLNFARRAPAKRESCHLAEVVHATIPLLQSFARQRSATITTEIPEEVDDNCQADRGQLQQVISNLVMNAILSKDRDVHVHILLANRRVAHPAASDQQPTVTLALTVADDGNGIPDSARPHLFEPFFTTRDTGEGTGLGLSIVHGIVSEHGGWVDVKSEPGRGSEFTVYLPQES